MKAKLDTYAIAYVDGLAARVAELEAENKHLAKLLECYRAHTDVHRALLAQYDTERTEAQAVKSVASRALDRLEKLVANATQARCDENWASERTVLVEFQPVSSGWYASAPDGVVGINATAPTIHGALRALREKMEAKP